MTEAEERIIEVCVRISDRLQLMEAVWLRMSERQMTIEATQQRILLLLGGGEKKADTPAMSAEPAKPQLPAPPGPEGDAPLDSPGVQPTKPEP